MIETANPRTRLCLLHHAAEDAQDVERTMATIEGDPVYQFFPVGLQMVGREMARRFYTQYLPRRYQPRRSDAVPCAMHEVDVGLMFESAAMFPDADGRYGPPLPSATLVVAGAKGVIAERLWASEPFFRWILGDLYDELEPIDWGHSINATFARAAR